MQNDYSSQNYTHVRQTPPAYRSKDFQQPTQPGYGSAQQSAAQTNAWGGSTSYQSAGRPRYTPSSAPNRGPMPSAPTQGQVGAHNLGVVALVNRLPIRLRAGPGVTSRDLLPCHSTNAYTHHMSLGEPDTNWSLRLEQYGMSTQHYHALYNWFNQEFHRKSKLHWSIAPYLVAGCIIGGPPLYFADRIPKCHKRMAEMCKVVTAEYQQANMSFRFGCGKNLPNGGFEPAGVYIEFGGF